MTDEFYNELYINNKSWNTSKPNSDENDRWIVIRYFIESLGRNNLSILDVGCGRGVISNLLSRYGSVLGIDPVRSVIEYGKGLYTDIELMALSLEEYSYIFPDKKYDLVVCTEVLEHVVDKVGFLKKIKNLISEDGHLVISTPREEVQQEWISKYGDPAQPIEEWISTDNFIKLLDECGFKRLGYKTASIFGVYQVHLLSV